MKTEEANVEAPRLTRMSITFTPAAEEKTNPSDKEPVIETEQ